MTLMDKLKDQSFHGGNSEETVPLEAMSIAELEEFENQIIRETQEILEQKLAVIRARVNEKLHMAFAKYKEDLLKVDEEKKAGTHGDDFIKMFEKMILENFLDKINGIKEDTKKGLSV